MTQITLHNAIGRTDYGYNGAAAVLFAKLDEMLGLTHGETDYELFPDFTTVSAQYTGKNAALVIGNMERGTLAFAVRKHGTNITTTCVCEDEDYALFETFLIPAFAGL